MKAESSLQSTPPGFTLESWTQFSRDGILVIENALSPQFLDSVQELVAVIRSVASQESSDAGLRLQNVVEFHPLLEAFIANPAHIGFLYDIYGDSLKLLASELFVRPGSQSSARLNTWHFDGPRLVPFDVFSPELPLRVKAGFWLSDMREDGMGNLRFIRGSHRWPYLEQYQRDCAHPAEEVLCVGAGSLVLMYGGLWHRVAPNTSEVDRVNLYLEYGPSWIQANDRFSSDPQWLAGLSREERIVMRSYQEPNHYFKPPASDTPLFLPRIGQEPLEQPYSEDIPTNLRKNPTWVEQLRRNKSDQGT